MDLSNLPCFRTRFERDLIERLSLYQLQLNSTTTSISRVPGSLKVLRGYRVCSTALINSTRVAARCQSTAVSASKNLSSSPPPAPPSIRGMTSPILASTSYYMRPLPSTCIAFNSVEGKRIFAQALKENHLESYFLLAGKHTGILVEAHNFATSN